MSSFLGSNANSTNNNWGASSGFARSASLSGPTGGSLFSKPSPASNNTSGGLFGSLNPPSGSLFGNQNQPTTNSGGLFGNSTNNNNGPTANNASQPATSGGLFGNSTQAQPSGGLFGNSSKPAAPGGLLGTTNQTQPSGGLFGNSKPASSGGLFGNTNQTQTSGGLFGNSSQTNQAPSGGLFGVNQQSSSGGLFNNASQPQQNNAQSGGLFGNTNSSAPSGGLFGNSNTASAGGLFNNNNNQTSGGLFGNKTQPSTGGLFGNSNSSSTGGLFQNSNNNAPIDLSINKNPYNYDNVLSNVQSGITLMPESITSNLYAENNNNDSTNRKRRFSYIGKQNSTKKNSSLLSILGQTFKIFRNPVSMTNFESVKGLFTTSNYLNTKEKKSILPKNDNFTLSKIQKGSLRTTIGSSSMGVKRLVIKSKPLKFHMINANKVFNPKRRRIDAGITPATELLYDDSSSEDDIDADSNVKNTRYAYKVNTGAEKSTGASSLKVLTGESIDAVPTKALVLDDADSNEGYWCSPPIGDLMKMTPEELKKVDNFIIGRINCGQIAYSYPVDLTEVAQAADDDGVTLNKVLFEDTIAFKSKFIRTFYGKVKKSAIGFGMNVPATITLEGIVPPSGKSTNDYINHLKAKEDMEFVTYDPITYVWTFKVKHFSIWGLVDEGDLGNTDEDRKILELKRKQDAEEAEAALEYARVYKSGEYDQEIKKQRLSHNTNGVPGGWNGGLSTQDNPLNKKRGLVANEITRQIDLFKLEQTVNNLNLQVSDITIDSSDSDTPSSPESLVFVESNTPINDNRKFEYLKQLVSMLPKNVDMKDIVDEKAYEPEIVDEAVFNKIQIRPNLAVSHDWLVQLELANDMNSSLNPFVAEANSRKQRLDVERVDELLFADFNKESLDQNQVSTPTNNNRLDVIDDIEVESDEEIYPNNISRIMEFLLLQSNIVSRDNGFPFVDKTEELEFSDIISGDLLQEEEKILKLCSALFDNNSDYYEVGLDDVKQRHLEEINKKRVFGEWLKYYNGTSIKELLELNKHNPLEVSFIHLCAGDLKSAIDVAIKSENYHLSVILTLTDSNDEAIAAIASNQLRSWKDDVESIPKSIKKVYQVLSGEFDAVLSDLPWNVALAVQLFYGDNSLRLHEVFNKFDEKFVESISIVDLIRLYSKLQADNSSLSLFNSSNLNTKINWVLHKILSTKYPLEAEQFDLLSSSFGGYLNKVGLWKDAIFVYSHTTDADKSKKAIREIVISNIKYIKDDSYKVDHEEEIVNVFKVPRNLIDEAIAIRKRQQGDYWNECEALVRSQLWERAHATIATELGPTVTITNDQESITHLLEIVSQFPESGLIIPQWNHGAGIYENFFNLSDTNMTSLNFLLENIPLAHEKSLFNAKTALKIISRKVGDLAIENSDKIENVSSKIRNLYFGESERNYFEIRLQHL